MARTRFAVPRRPSPPVNGLITTRLAIDVVVSARPGGHGRRGVVTRPLAFGHMREHMDYSSFRER